MIEAQLLSFIRANQKLIRCDILNGLQEVVNRGKTDPSSIGRHIVLSASFTGGTRYMFNNCQDAMAICKKFGYLDLFITITCNVNWSEIRDFVSPRGLTASDKPDIVCRVFKRKLDQMMTNLKKMTSSERLLQVCCIVYIIYLVIQLPNMCITVLIIFIQSGMYTVEFQKRGLSHVHIPLWLDGESKLKTAADIDNVISAELPNQDLYPKLHKVVSSYMIHGSCGPARFNSQCMKEGKCSKYYPNNFTSCTTIDEEGYLSYRRREIGSFVEKNGI